MRTRLYLIRHGAAEGNDEGRYLGRRSDPPLTGDGRRQARAAGCWLQRHFRCCMRCAAPSVILSSGLRRSDETAWIISRRLGVPWQVDRRFQELDFGRWDGLNYRQVENRDPGLLRRWYDDPMRTSPPAGETLRQMRARVRDAYLEAVRGGRHGSLVVVAHGGPIRALLASCAFVADDDERFAREFFSHSCPVGSVSVIRAGPAGNLRIGAKVVMWPVSPPARSEALHLRSAPVGSAKPEK